jgi:hypothetical protein
MYLHTYLIGRVQIHFLLYRILWVSGCINYFTILRPNVLIIYRIYLLHRYQQILRYIMISIEPSCYQQSNISFVYIPFTVILTSNQFFGNHYQLRSHISLYRFYTKRKHSSLFIHSSLKNFSPL